MRNNIRFDLSGWLIHFFRDIDLMGGSSISFPEHMGWGNIFEDVRYSALFMLRCALRNGRLWATWSFRNGERTIYGPDPAICFTDMPIAAFLEAGHERAARGEAMSSFALVFPKEAMHRINANPVIYGLSQKNVKLPLNTAGGPRIIDPAVLPEAEQHRYVTYSNRTDWTHEREWRWPFRGNYNEVERRLDEFGVVCDWSDIPGLDFYSHDIPGMGVLVKTLEQAMWVVNDILTLVDRGNIDRNRFAFVLAADTLPPLAHLQNPAQISAAIASAAVDLEPHFNHSKTLLNELSRRFHDLVSEITANAQKPVDGEVGGCWLWLLDNTALLARALIEDGSVVVSDSGKYLVNLDQFSHSWNLRQRESMTEELAEIVKEEFNLECGYHSVLNSHDVNAVPFYNGDHIDNKSYYNCSWIG
ncbi:DUF4427 domain-containing protein [Burkholderia ubonensis]|uniref:DUF4427 domain-containing protein n=1 Tax=Burkholderia ubonensis TaxID=101571 RepID=UPI000AB708FE|nr:DUF4427 domain-containing protein [Burkholderia ubonensis]